jgi:CelD/BcsL family acetyltransferase involved in cellulose biosynthesis
MTMTPVRSLAALRTLQADWEAMEGRCGTPLLGFAWFLSAAESLYDERQLRIEVARSAGEVTGIAPLLEEPTEGGTRLTLLGTSRLFEPSDWLCADATTARALANQALEAGPPLLLERVPTTSCLCTLLPSISRSGISISRVATPSLAVDTSGPWDRYAARLSASHTARLARLRRKAERDFGRVVIEAAALDPADVEPALERFVALEATGWKAREGSALGQQRQLFDFYRRYGRRAAAAGTFRVSTLMFGSNAAAMEIVVDAFNRRWQLKIAYDEGVARYAPGLQLVHHTVADSFARDLTAYEFLGVAEPWEQRWLPEPREYQKLMLYPASVRGAVEAIQDVTAFAWRRARRQAAALTPDMSDEPAARSEAMRSQ